ncbi:MAG: hypothetical protein HY907_07265 [Deltaproteobacteria bacterium]|nr:hypothetical protein [Deltaproteobacteria bacterium]
MTKLLCPVLVLVAAVAGCSSGDSGGGGDGGACAPAQCQSDCEAHGYLAGTCTTGGICQCAGRPGADADVDGDAADADADPDAGEDGGGDEPDAEDDGEEFEVDPCAPPACGPEELCGETTRGDGVDNDCDTEVDEVCDCGTIGTTLDCFPGDPSACPVGVPCRGGCTRGVETCTEFRTWGGCIGVVGPAEEICDGADNDCDGLYDEYIDGCESPVYCPGSVSVAPMTYVPLTGSEMFPDPFDSWLWELICPTTVGTCPLPEDPVAQDTQVLILSSGTYRARATIHADATTYTCEFAILAQGQGLRVELTWDTQGSAHGDTDVDLHLHQWGAESDFFSSPQDCYYGNCKASSCCWSGPPSVDWSLPHTMDLAACQDSPHGEGAQWVSHGFCANPRLDVDVITCNSAETDPTLDFCAPENINVDNPPWFEPMRVMVNYYSSHSYFGTTNAFANIYCGGALRASFGPQPLTLSGSSSGENWMVADVMFYEGECGALDCEIVPVDTVITGPAFGPPWSTFVHGP